MNSTEAMDKARAEKKQIAECLVNAYPLVMVQMFGGPYKAIDGLKQLSLKQLKQLYRKCSGETWENS